MQILRQFPPHTSFGILASEFNKRFGKLYPDLSVQVALPSAKSTNPEKEVFWVFWETNKLPSYPLRLLKSYDHVWTPSHWLSEVLRRGGVESGVVHLALDSKDWSPSRDGHSIFRFLWVNEWIHRKGGDLLIEAFLDSFKPSDNVELVIKPNYTNQDCRSRLPRAEEIIAAHSGGPKDKVKIVNEFLPQARLKELYGSCDCYVYPLRTQGASLTLLEAQACGLPTIITRYGGCIDYVIEECTYFIDPIEFQPVTKIDFFAGYGDQDLGNEAVPNLDQLKEHLLYCYHHPEEVLARGRRASDEVKRRFGWESFQSEAMFQLQEPRKKKRFHLWS